MRLRWISLVSVIVAGALVSACASTATPTETTLSTAQEQGGEPTSQEQSVPPTSQGEEATDCAGLGISPAVVADRDTLLPEPIIQAGAVRVATDPTLPPYEFTDDDDQLVGLDIELGALIACALDLDITWEKIDFDGLLAAVKAGRYDFAIAGISDTSEREEVMDMIDYQTEGTAIIVAAENPHDVATIDDLCGLNVAAVKGSVPLELLSRKNESCDEAINILSFPKSTDGFLAVRSGRADAVMETLGTAIWFEKSGEITGLRALTTELYAQGYQAIAFPKNPDSAKLRDAVQAALTSMIEDGSYGQLYKKWDLEANMVDVVTVNDAARFADMFYNVD